MVPHRLQLVELESFNRSILFEPNRLSNANGYQIANFGTHGFVIIIKRSIREITNKFSQLPTANSFKVEQNSNSIKTDRINSLECSGRINKCGKI